MNSDTQDRTQDYSDAFDSAGRVWRPANQDVLEGALSRAAVDSGLLTSERQWEKFLQLAAKYLDCRTRPPRTTRG